MVDLTPEVVLKLWLASGSIEKKMPLSHADAVVESLEAVWTSGNDVIITLSDTVGFELTQMRGTQVHAVQILRKD